MRAEGLEPPRLAPPAPKAGVSTSFTTPARRLDGRGRRAASRWRIVWSRPAMAADAVVIDHPNRRRAASRVTQVIVVLLLLLSAVLIAVVTIGGWEELQGAKALQIAYIVLDV